MKKLASTTDPLWYKDAVIYEIHVRAFSDSNNDGIGDFPGLMSKLDYLQDLGVTCLWLLPFFPSPLRDDGYDIANYVDVNPSYGTLSDFKLFLDAAHARNMQVMIELVINHTSDQHPWFKAAQKALPGSPEREMYVWSDTDQLYKDARIIFTDTEKSNWTWDETAKAYYWHRFFSHQPDLNFDNPRVIEEVLNAMRFWLDMGVDALRMDAIPYLVERDGTSCENLPETHVAIKKIRAAIDAGYSNRLILAEANQWPADVRPYFGNGDECHMAFHFPLMPRIYMALRQEDRLPITDIMAQTPEIPENCQWGLFLRNHDELTLEMVTDDERDYMYLAYSADPRMRINVGIRRRLAPLVDNNRRRIELLNSLLLSFPGTPILYYGDEIGMGDNIYLGDRNGVRTPMQWNSDRNAGFSKCDPARLYFPVVMDPIYGYQVVNVEAQLSDQSSLLHWTRNMIALRKLFHVFGRGKLEFLHPENRKILAYLRSLINEDGTVETVLCVANLSRFAQPVSLDLAEYAGATPVEMLGYVPFPPITKQAYPLTVAPYSFLWFELQSQPAASTRQLDDHLPLSIEDLSPGTEILMDGLASLAQGSGAAWLESTLPAWLMRQRWFGSKSKTIEKVDVVSHAAFSPPALPDSYRDVSDEIAIFFVKVNYRDGGTDTYQVPMALRSGEKAGEIAQQFPHAVISNVTTSSGRSILYDAMFNETFRQGLLKLVEDNQRISLANVTAGQEATPTSSEAQGFLRGKRSIALIAAQGSSQLSSRVNVTEQSNTSIFFDQKMIMKLFRKLQPDENPDIEIGRFLTEFAHFPRIANFLGEISQFSDGVKTSTAILQELVPNEGDCWSWTLEELGRFYESVAACPPPTDVGGAPTLVSEFQPSSQIIDHAGLYLESAALLGRRTAEMHLALATDTDDPAFRPETFAMQDMQSDAQRLSSQVTSALEALKSQMATISDEVADNAGAVLSRRVELLSCAKSMSNVVAAGSRIRIHGDYHLGQLLRVKNDFVILDFEGEPARPIEERRRKQCSLKDVAGMIRSFSYAAWSGFDQYIQRHPDRRASMEPWVRLWQNSVSSEFLKVYWNTASERLGLLPSQEQSELLLKAYLLEKALYELQYELNNRPEWMHIPLDGILDLSSDTRSATEV